MAAVPDTVNAHTGICNVLNEKGDYGCGMVECRKALALRPEDDVAHGDLGDALLGKGDLDGAIIEYRTVLALKPGDYDTTSYGHGRIAYALYDKGTE